MIARRVGRLSPALIRRQESTESSPFSQRVIEAEKLEDGRYCFHFEKEFKAHRCDGPPSSSVTTREELMWLYENMYLCRRVEMAADGLYKQRAVRGFLHLCNGQALCRGWKPKEVLAELLGRADGVSRGKGGSMHMYSAKNNFYGGNGIVGAQAPVGTGVAFANKFHNNGRVCFALYGDGAANQGQLYESFNMAAIWRLPVIFCCENNHYGMGTSVERASATLDWYTRGDYIPGLKVDGMDALAVKAASAYAAEWARSGRGPMVLEYETYRYMGHSMSDPGTSYRTRDEITSVRARRDPIERTKARLLVNDIASKEEIKEIEKNMRKVVDEAVEFAKHAKDPELKESYTDIYVEPTTVRGRTLTEEYVPQ